LLSFDEVGDMLDDIAEELPREFFNDLNGGVLLLPEACQGQGDEAHSLYIMGKYIRDVMGRYIIIYYGSFAALHKNLPPDKLRRELKETLIHEFTHHMESLAGDNSLEIKDELRLARFRNSRSHQGK